MEALTTTVTKVTQRFTLTEDEITAFLKTHVSQYSGEAPANAVVDMSCEYDVSSGGQFRGATITVKFSTTDSK